MDVVLTRLRDFSCKETTFDDYKSAVLFRNQPLGEEVCREERTKCERAGRLDIEHALAWLRQELMEMRSQDQALIRQLMSLHAGIEELKQECALDEEGEEEDLDEVESWDSNSEASGTSGSSYSEMCFYSSIHSPLRTSPLHLGFLPKRAFGRRSSVP